MVSTASTSRSCLRAAPSVTALVGACILSVGVSMAEQRQLGAHEHGTAALNVAVSDATLSVEFIAPAANLVGFEHAATTDDQVQAIADAKEVLAGGGILGLPGDAECQLAASEVEHEAENHDEHGDEHAEHEEDDDEHEDEHAEHEEDDEHEDHAEHEGEEKAHSEFHAQLTYDCGNIGALTHIDVEIFRLFPGNKDIHTQVITPTGQSGGELTTGAARLMLP